MRPIDPGALIERLHGLGPWAPIGFVALYVVAAVFFVPGSVLTLAAGALFGGFWGTVWVSAGSTGGAAAAFLASRFLARRWVERRLAGHPRWPALQQAAARQGWKVVLLARLSPVLPFNLLNYAFGLTGVPFAHYVLASWLGMLPATVLYVNAAALAASGLGGQRLGPWRSTLYGIGIAATLVLVVVLSRLAKRALLTSVPG